MMGASPAATATAAQAPSDTGNVKGNVKPTLGRISVSSLATGTACSVCSECL
jgi:hypothetical protein